MKHLLFALIAFFSVLVASAQTKDSAMTLDKSKPLIAAEASCGQCQFGLEGKGCDLAVRIDGKAYFVDGTSIDKHGDAHAADGFCNAVRKAQLQGQIVEGRYKVTYFKLVAEDKKGQKKKAR